MEKHESEKTWDSFWTSGRVDDYLSYRNSIGSCKDYEKERKSDGTVSDSDRYGTNDHAHIGI